jgi:tetratricopeptide (TPR) repeat protein
VLLATTGLFAAAGAYWWFASSRDPFAQLEEIDSSHAGDGVRLSETGPFPAGTTPADQLRSIDEQLRAHPNDLTLLSQKIHLGLEYAPGVAAQECRRILEQSPGNYFALHHAAMAYLAMTNLDRALHFASKALQAHDTIEARFVAGHVFYAKGDFPNALNHYRAILAKNPHDAAAKVYVEKAERALATRHGATERARVKLGSPN